MQDAQQPHASTSSTLLHRRCLVTCFQKAFLSLLQRMTQLMQDAMQVCQLLTHTCSFEAQTRMTSPYLGVFDTCKKNAHHDVYILLSLNAEVGCLVNGTDNVG